MQTQWSEEFPQLASQYQGQRIIYFDNAASTLRHRSVIEATQLYLAEQTSNIHRGIHTLSEHNTYLFEKTRTKLKELIHAQSEAEIIFTSGTTMGINLIARSYGEVFLQPGDEIILSLMEHHSNIVPWQRVCEVTGAKLKIIPLDENGQCRLDVYQEYLSEKTKIISVTATSNALGTINPIPEMIQMARKKTPAIFVVDGAQAIAHTTIDVQAWDMDFLVFSAHKMYGPTGAGALYGKKSLLEKMPPFLGGGEMIREVSFEKTTFNDLPFKFEAGTPPISEVISWSGAIDFLLKQDYQSLMKQEIDLYHYLYNKISKLEGIKIFGHNAHKNCILSFNLKDIHPQDIASFLNKYGVAIRTGHHCTQPLWHHLGVSATCRASLNFYNTKEEIDIFVDSLLKIQQFY